MARRFPKIAQVLPRLCLLGLAALPLCAQLPAGLPPPPPPAPEPEYAEPPEEDKGVALPTDYTFNPLQAKKEIQTGDFYTKRGNHRGAAMRYREATLWDDGSVDAFFKWGEASEKLKDYAMAREAFEGLLKLEPDSKRSGEIRKRMQKYPPAKSVAAQQPDDLKKLQEAEQKDRQLNNRLQEKGIILR